MCVVTWSSNQKLIEDLFKTVSVIRAVAHTGRVTGAGGGRFNGHWAPVIHKSNRRLAVSNTGLRFQYTGAGPGPGHSLDNISISHSRSICASISCLYMRDYPLLCPLLCPLQTNQNLNNALITHLRVTICHKPRDCVTGMETSSQGQVWTRYWARTRARYCLLSQYNTAFHSLRFWRS